MTKIFVVTIMLFACCITGCGDGGAAVLKRRSDLEQLGLAYREYHKKHGVAPAGPDELLQQLMSMDDQSDEVISATTALEEGDIMMVWSGKLDDELAAGTFVIGFEAGVPAHGGYVVMDDATVKVLKQGEFREDSLLPTSR